MTTDAAIRLPRFSQTHSPHFVHIDHTILDSLCCRLAGYLLFAHGISLSLVYAKTSGTVKRFEDFRISALAQGNGIVFVNSYKFHRFFKEQEVHMLHFHQFTCLLFAGIFGTALFAARFQWERISQHAVPPQPALSAAAIAGQTATAAVTAQLQSVTSAASALLHRSWKRPLRRRQRHSPLLPPFRATEPSSAPQKWQCCRSVRKFRRDSVRTDSHRNRSGGNRARAAAARAGIAAHRGTDTAGSTGNVVQGVHGLSHYHRHCLPAAVQLQQSVWTG